MANHGRPPVHILVVLFVMCLGTVCAAQSPPSSPQAAAEPDRVRAEELFNQGKLVEAMPLFEKLAAAHPQDVVLHERWAWCTLGMAQTLPRGEQRMKLRARARAIAVEAQKLGDNSQLLQTLLDTPEDGSEPAFSDNDEVNSIMTAAEADFARGDLEKARAGYLHALLIDPRNYPAALFIGDTYFREHRTQDAGQWFARAIQIDPDQETAYRYWGDALMAAGDQAGARARFIDAIVAEPYNRHPWDGLSNWLQRNQLPMNLVRLKDGATFHFDEKHNAVVTVDESIANDKPDSLAWMAYATARAAWHTEESQIGSANAARDRHSLQEEANALETMVKVLKEQKDYAALAPQLDPAVQALIKIEEAGFLEPFVLLNRADAGIAQDYASYRQAHRELIRRYLDEFVVSKLDRR